MHVNKFFTEQGRHAAKKASLRAASDADSPRISPVHALQRSLSRSIVRGDMRRFHPDVAAMRIGLLVVAPMLMWSAIFRLAAVVQGG